MDTNDLLHRWSTLSFDEIEDELRTGEDDAAAAQLLGPETVAELKAVSFAPPSFGPKEPVVLLPGIMGSMLASIRGVTTLLWINPLLFLKGNAAYLRLAPDGEGDEVSRVETAPISLEKLTYLKIGLRLNRETELYEFPYDWRRAIEYNADVLAASIERWAAGSPDLQFTLVAHSMGGLVSRTYMARHPEKAARRVKRLIVHGTPHFGAANAVDTLLNGNSMMATVDRLNEQNGMRSVIYHFPSVYQLLPAPADCLPSGNLANGYPIGFDLYDAAAWGLPQIQQKYLDAARRLHETLAASDPQIPISVIAGCHIDTLVSANLGKSIGFQAVREVEGENSGDGTVPLWSAKLPGADVYYIQEIHRKLPNNGKVIDATLDLIRSGSCDLPRTLPPRKTGLFSFAPPIPPEVQAEELRAKISTGTAGSEELESLFFAF